MRLWTYWPSLTSLFAGRQPSYLSAGMSILKLRDFHCSSVGRKGLDFAVDQQFYIYYILVPEALKVREAISSDQYFCSFSFYHLDINCHYFKVNNLNLSENVKSVVHTIIYMYNSIPWHTYHYIGDTSGPSTTCKFEIMQSDLNSISMRQSLKVWVSPYL